jgi:hypothetical protein
MIGSIRSVVSLLLLALAAPLALAEEDMPLRWLVTTYEVKPGMQGHHEQLARRYVAAARATDWASPWFTSTSVFSEEPRYAVAIPIRTMEMFAAPPTLIVDAEGPDAIAEIQEIASRTYERVESTMAVYRADLSHPAPEGDAPPVGYMQIRARVSPGMNEAYEDYIRSIVQASDDEYWSLFVGAFGEATWYVANVRIDSWAQMDGGPGTSIPARLRAEFGEGQGNRMQADGAALIDEMHVDLMRWRPDLSWAPDAD